MNDGSEIAEKLNRLATEFDELCITRHEIGAKEYGPFTFLGNDVVRMMLEELADTANYCRYQAIKLLLLQGLLEEDPKIAAAADSDGDITIGVESFRGTSEGWKK